jgi:hypothetical protein
MSKIKDDLAIGRSLSEIPLWPVVGLIVVVFITAFAYAIILHVSYIPKYLLLIQGEAASEVRVLLKEGMEKIIYTFLAWFIVLLLISSTLTYQMWKAKKFIQKLLK